MDTITSVYMLLCDLLSAYGILGFIYFLWPQRSYWAFKTWLFKLVFLWIALSVHLLGDFARITKIEELTWLWSEPFRPLLHKTATMIGLFVGYKWLQLEIKRNYGT